MRKDQTLTLIKEALGLANKKEAEGFLKEVDALILALENGLETGDKVKIGDRLVITKKHVEERQGVAMGKTWVKPAHDKLVAKIK